jgi:hypothetical protein
MAEPTKSGLGPEFTYDLTALKKVDPKLVHYEESAKLSTGLAAPVAIAAGPDGRFFVAGDKAVRYLDRTGKLVGEIKLDASPRAVALGPAVGDKPALLYVAMAEHVEVFDLQGKRLATWASASEKAYLTSLAAGEADVFVADAHTAAVLRYDLAGKLLGRIGEKNDAKRAPGIVVPSPFFKVVLGRDGMLWVTNPGSRSVECYAYDGTFRLGWGKASPKIEGFCGCCNPTHLAITADGSFITSEKGLPRVKVYNASGEFESVVAPPSAFEDNAEGLDLAVDSAGRILVLDPDARSVRIFTKKPSLMAPAATGSKSERSDLLKHSN